VSEVPVQVQSSATVYAAGNAVARRSTTTLLRVFPAPPYSEIVGGIDEGGPVGIDSPGDAGGQSPAPDLTGLLIQAYTLSGGHRAPDNVWNSETWSDGNSSGSGPLP